MKTPTENRRSVPQPQFVPQASPISANTLDILVAPVAFYPDVILRDLFRASSHQVEIVQANQWVHQIRDTSGSLPRSGYDDNWDASVKAMTAYPDLLQHVSADPNWLNKLGYAFTAQPGDVMNAVQRMRMQATSLRASRR